MLGLLVLFGMIALAIGVHGWLFGPKRLEDGRWKLVDHRDGIGAGVRSLALFVFATWAYCLVGFLLWDRQAEVKNALAMGVGVTLIYAVALFVSVRKLREVIAAAPGELIVPSWPLPSDASVELVYRRRVRWGGEMTHCGARLVKYRVHSERTNDGHSRTCRDVVETVSLTGRSGLKDGLIKARWTCVMPNPFDLQRAAFAFVEALFSRHGGGREEWWLEVNVETASGPALDSQFQLEIGPAVAGRSRAS